jgi:hypothetical protein
MQGRWVPVSGHLFWVPEEPWGWVPYHLGLWHWDTKHGWVWIPGSAFAPAWVSWSTCHEARYYRPLSLWDWNLAHARGYRYGSPWGADPCGFYGTGWNDRRVVVDLGIQQQPAAPATPNPSDDGETTPIRRLPERPLLPLPNDLEKVANRIAKAAGQDGGDVRAAVERTRQSAGLVPSEELARRVEASAPLEAKHDLGPRFRDWNSDVRAARGVGGRIVYSSESNAVRCEDCRRPLVRIDLSAFGGWSEERRSGSSGSSTSSDGGGSAAAAPTTTNSGPNNGGGREKIRD